MSALGENLRVYGEINELPDERVREVGKAFARADGQSLTAQVMQWLSDAWNRIKSTAVSAGDLCVTGVKRIINAPSWLIDQIKNMTGVGTTIKDNYCKVHPDLPECQELPDTITSYLIDKADELEELGDIIRKGELNVLDVVDILGLLENGTDWLDRLGINQEILGEFRDYTFLAETILNFIGALFGGSLASTAWLIANQDEVNLLISDKGYKVLETSADVIIKSTEEIAKVTNTDAFEEVTAHWPSLIGHKILTGIGWILTLGQMEEIPCYTPEELVEQEKGNYRGEEHSNDH